MSKRSAKFVPALFAGILAGTSLAAVTDLRAQTTQAQATKPPADNCLAAPGNTTPAGGHWYYRIDRATKRKCWYLREENDQANDKSARAADTPAATPAAAAETAPPPTAIARKAIADARAEWISQQARTEQNLPANVEPPATDAVAAPPVEDGKRAAMPNVLAPTPMAETRWPETRWPEPSAVSSSAASSPSSPTELRTAAADPPSDQPEQAAEMQQPAVAQASPVAPAAVEPSTAKPTASLQMLLLVMAAALALAGITVSLIMRFGRARARAVIRRNRRATWDSTWDSAQANARRPSRSMAPGEEARMRRTAEGVHHPRATENRERQVRAFSSEVETGSRQENASNQESRAAPFRVNRNGNGSSDALARLARSAQT